jgi:hypothetical protein
LEKKSAGLLELETAVLECFLEKTPLSPLGVKTLVNKKNSSSLIIIDMELRFEPCVLNLIWKKCAKDTKKRDEHLIFINFGVKKFTIKNIQKK